MASNRLRILAAISVTVALLILGVGGLGFVTADEGGGLPETFRLAMPRGGDRGTYSYQVPNSTFGPTTFEWGEAEPFVMPDGMYRAAHVRTHSSDDVVAKATSSTSGMSASAERTFHQMQVVDALTGQLVAGTAFSGVSSGQHVSGLLILSESRSTTSVETGVAWTDADCDLPSVLRTGVEVAQTITLACGAFPMNFNAVGFEEIRGIPTVRFDASGDDRTVSAWFNEAIPDEVAFQITDGDGDLYMRRELVGFEQGDGQGAGEIILPEPLALPSMQMRPRQAWGLDDSGLVHPFPASAAWTAARDDLHERDFAAFLERNPDAYAIETAYEELTEGSRTKREWDFEVRGDAERAGLRVVQTTAPPGAETTDFLGLYNPAQPVTSTSIAYLSIDNGNSVVPSVPTELPTAATLLALWAAFEPGEGEPNTWGLTCRFSCAEVSLLAGRSHIEIPASTATSPRAEGAENTTLMMFDARGVPTARVVQQSEVWTSRNPAPVTSPPDPVAKPRDPTVGAAAFLMPWAPETRASAAGVTLLALLAGAVTYGMWGMFSRVSDDRVLQNAARRRLLEAVTADPGIHYQELVRRTGLGHGSMEHHLRALTRAGLVTSVKARGYTSYFANGAPRQAREAAGALKSAGALAVLDHVRTMPGARAIDVAAATGLSPATVNHHVHRLADAGLVRVSRMGRELRIDLGAGAPVAE